MKIDISQLDNVLDDILQNMDLEELTPEAEAELSNATPMALMDRFLSWHGIIGYTEMIMDAMDTINRAAGIHQENLVRQLWDDEMANYIDTYGDSDDVIQKAADQEGTPHIFCTLARMHLHIS